MAWVGGEGGMFLGEVKARPIDIISFSLDSYKQKQSTGKAGGFITFKFMIYISNIGALSSCDFEFISD